MLGWGQIVGLLRLRFAAGVGVLAASLLIGSAAVAVADPDSSSSAANGANDAGQQSSTDAKKQKKDEKKDGTDTKDDKKDGTDKDDKKDSGLAAAVSNPVAAVTDAVAPVTHAVAPVTHAVAPVSNAVAPVTHAVAPVTHGVAPAPDGVAPAPDGGAPVPDGVALASDVIALMQDMLTSGAGAVVPLTQLQSDLSSFLLGIAGAEPVVAGLGGGAGRSAAAGASVASQLPLVLPLAGVPGVPVAGNATGIATLLGVAPSTFGAMSQVGPASSLPGMAPPAPSGAIPMGVRSFLRHARELPLPLAVSLAALAAAALPGAGGLVILTGAGVRVGYRQAKAGFVLRTAGIARFAGPGPLGVVRSGSLVVVRPRALRDVRPGALSAGCLLDKVA